MEKQLYMLQWEKQRVNLCAYRWPYRKVTAVWTQGFEWEPKGETVDGLCGGKCGQGTVSKVTGKFVNHQAHSVHPEKGARGAGHMQEKHGMPMMMLQEVLTAAGVKEGDTVLDLCAGHQSMEGAATQKGARYVAVDRVAKLKRSRNVREGWAAVAIVCGDKLLCFKRTVEGGQGEVEMMLPGGRRDAANRDGETDHDAPMRHLEEQTGITNADCEDLEWLLDVPISASSTYGARYFVYKVHVSEWDWSPEMKMKMKQNGLEKEWVKSSKADEQASVKPSKWRRWSKARREEHRGRMWGHIQEAGAGRSRCR